MRCRARVTVFTILVFGFGVEATDPFANADESRLTDLLARTARVASLYLDLALKFECTEVIEYKSREDWDPPTGLVKFSYLYERTPDGKLTDCRLWRTNPTHAKNPRCVEPSESRIPVYLNNAYQWIFAFLEVRRPWHEFRIVGQDTVLGRAAIMVDFGPRQVVRANFNDWHGRAWIDRESHQLLRVEAYRPKSWEAKQALNRAKAAKPDDSVHLQDYEIESVITEFNESKNGMRFASRVELHQSRYSWKSDYKEKKLLDVVQTYTKYRFYNVATQAEIQGIVEGKPKSAKP